MGKKSKRDISESEESVDLSDEENETKK